MKLFKGHTYIRGRSSPYSLYDQDLVSMDVAGSYDPINAEGFIKTNAIRLQAQHALKNRVAK